MTSASDDAAEVIRTAAIAELRAVTRALTDAEAERDAERDRAEALARDNAALRRRRVVRAADRVHQALSSLRPGRRP